jgi:hypothetical protein
VRYAMEPSIILARPQFTHILTKSGRIVPRWTTIEFNDQEPRTWTACTILLAGLITNQSSDSGAYLRCRSGLFIKISNLVCGIDDC